MEYFTVNYQTYSCGKRHRPFHIGTQADVAYMYLIVSYQTYACS